MKFYPIAIILVSVIISISCQNDYQTVKLNEELEQLRKENDSLKRITEKIKEKYVFDSLTIRQIPFYYNTSKLNSIYQEEFVFVGYNSNGNTSVILGDSIYFDNGMKVFNGDTLISKNGSFLHQMRLLNDQNYYGGILKTQNEFGKSFETHFRSAVGIIKD